MTSLFSLAANNKLAWLKDNGQKAHQDEQMCGTKVGHLATGDGHEIYGEFPAVSVEIKSA